MLVRVVKMTFRNDDVESFKKLFNDKSAIIRSFEGCMRLELLQDQHQPNIFFTYSHWLNEAALSHYRNSQFFRDTWQQTKAFFAEKAEAWSLQQLDVLP